MAGRMASVLACGAARPVSKLAKDELRKVVRETKIEGIRLVELLKREGNGVYIKWLKALMEMESTLEHDYQGTTYCPFPSTLRRVRRRTRGGLSYTNLLGEEKVNFRCGDVKGTFVRNEDILTSIVRNWTTERDITHLLGCIGTYILYNGRANEKETKKKMLSDIYHQITIKPWEIINANRASYITILKDPPKGSTVGNMTIKEYTEYRTTGSFLLTLDGEYNIIVKGASQIMRCDINSSHVKVFSEVIECNSTYMLNYFPFIKTLKNRIVYFGSKDKMLREKVKQKDFKWNNNYMKKFLPNDFRKVSRTCRSLLVKMDIENIWIDFHAAFLYCFCFNDPLTDPASDFKIKVNGYLIDFLGEEGIFRYNEEKRRYELLGIKFRDIQEKVPVCSLLKGLLDGFKIMPWDKTHKRVVPLKTLERGERTLQEWERISTYIHGTLFDVIKDPYIKFETSETYNERIVSILKERHIHHDILSGVKRQWSRYVEDETDNVSVKRTCLGEEEIYLNLGQDNIHSYNEVDDQESDYDSPTD
jgi:hypothetical protein